jgi:hypothetical protein
MLYTPAPSGQVMLRIFYVLNETTGVAETNVQVGLPTSDWDDTTAEWINERPTWGTPPNTYYRPLSNYADTYWSGATYDIYNDNTALPLGKSDTVGIVMSPSQGFWGATCDGDTMAYPWNLNTAGGTSFLNTWCRAT